MNAVLESSYGFLDKYDDDDEDEEDDDDEGEGSSMEWGVPNAAVCWEGEQSCWGRGTWWGGGGI